MLGHLQQESEPAKPEGMTPLVPATTFAIADLAQHCWVIPDSPVPKHDLCVPDAREVFGWRPEVIQLRGLQDQLVIVKGPSGSETSVRSPVYSFSEEETHI